jgi:glycerol-3-phosphate acyltransferase PlsY
MNTVDLIPIVFLMVVFSYLIGSLLYTVVRRRRMENKGDD